MSMTLEAVLCVKGRSYAQSLEHCARLQSTSLSLNSAEPLWLEKGRSQFPAGGGVANAVRPNEDPS